MLRGERLDVGRVGHDAVCKHTGDGEVDGCEELPGDHEQDESGGDERLARLGEWVSTLKPRCSWLIRLTFRI